MQGKTRKRNKSRHCKKCGGEVFFTDEDAYKNWKKHGEICFRCKWKDKPKKKQPVVVKEPKNDDADNSILDDMCKAFESLVENYKKQDKLHTKLHTLMKKHYGKDETWFTDFLYMECEFTQYFEDLKNLNKKNHWPDFERWMRKFEELKKGEKQTCKVKQRS